PYVTGAAARSPDVRADARAEKIVHPSDPASRRDAERTRARLDSRTRRGALAEGSGRSGSAGKGESCKRRGLREGDAALSLHPQEGGRRGGRRTAPPPGVFCRSS